jgi:ADP-dependent phosphofructokinase/glucokinase
VLGLGGCLDYEIEWDATVLQALANYHGLGSVDLERGDVIRTERALVCSILAFVRDGEGGERAVADHEVVEGYAVRHRRSVTLGGTSVRAGIVMSKIGVPSTLHLVSEDEQVRSLLPTDVEYFCSASEDSINPHLIVQFPRGARVVLADIEVVAPESNRLIYVCDPPNRLMELAPELGDMLADADVFLISGFNAMDARSLLDARMDTLREDMRQLRDDAVVVYEDAGFHVPGFERVVIDALHDRIDVYSLNEDELQAHLGRRVSLLDPVDVVGALRRVRDLLAVPTLVVHTRYWTLAYGARAHEMRAAIDGGVSMASARYLHGDAMTQDDYSAVANIPRQPVGEGFATRIESLLGDLVRCVAARGLEADSPTTVGLGDAFMGGMVAVIAGQATDRGADAAAPADARS